MTGRLLGVDHGSKRIGLALSDALGIGARELGIVHSTSRDRDFEQVLAIARREGARGFVVGVPHNPNAPEGVELQADKVKRWIEGLRDRTNLPIFEVSEYLTSAEARELARQLNRKPEQPIDDLAARVILQAYLDEQSYA